MAKIKDLTVGSETNVIIRFTIPMIIGNLFQQLYNVADTIIVGKFLGSNALAAVGSSFTLMVFLTSIILGLCMGSGVVFSTYFGGKDIDKLKKSFFTSFVFVGLITIIINVLALVFVDRILVFIRIPLEILEETKEYLQIIFYGIIFTTIYNFFAAVLRSLGNSVIPLIFLIIAAVINIVLDIIFIVPLGWGVGGAALATIIAQGFSAIGIVLYIILKVPDVRLERKHLHLEGSLIGKIAKYSTLTSIQQSIMNFGILLVQGLVNSFGISAMAAFAAAAKIDNFAYMPVQDFGNAFSTFIAQNKGAKKLHRIKKGISSAIKIITLYCIAISIVVLIFAKPLLSIFINVDEIEIINIGKQYLYIVASFYCLIGYLFMFYGLFRGIGKPRISIILTIVSLGTRVVLAYTLSSIPAIGLVGIWWAIPIGWAIADVIGFYSMRGKLFETPE